MPFAAEFLVPEPYIEMSLHDAIYYLTEAAISRERVWMVPGHEKKYS